LELKGYETGTIEKRSSIYTSIDNDLEAHSVHSLKEAAINEMEKLSDVSFEELLAESTEAWEELLQNALTSYKNLHMHFKLLWQ